MWRELGHGIYRQERQRALWEALHLGWLRGKSQSHLRRSIQKESKSGEFNVTAKEGHFQQRREGLPRQRIKKEE